MMKDLVSATCDQSGQHSDECILTHWHAAKEEGLDLKDTPGGWGPYGFSGARKKYSGLIDFEIFICLPAIRDVIRKRNTNRILFVFALILVMAFAALLPGSVSTYINEVLGLPLSIVFGAITIAIALYALRVSGFRARYLDLKELEVLGSNLEKRTAWSLSKRLAWKKAKQAGLDTVWSSSRFEELEIHSEDEWFFASTD